MIELRHKVRNNSWTRLDTSHVIINHVIINLKDGFDIDLADISDQWTSKNGEIPDQHNLLGAKFSTFDKVI